MSRSDALYGFAKADKVHCAPCIVSGKLWSYYAQCELRPGKVMALMGENGAGKSTLMKCMFGIYKMDEGEIEYEGEKVTITTPLDALNRGIAMVHQELQPIPARTVAENIWLGRYPTKKYGPVTVVDHAKMYKDTEELLKKLKLEINPRAKLGSLIASHRCRWWKLQRLFPQTARC